MPKTNILYPTIRVRLSGTDGNAFAIMGRVSAALRKHKIPEERISEFVKECKSGDYEHLLQTCCEWVDVY